MPLILCLLTVSNFSYCVNIHTLIEILSFLDLSLPYSLSCRAHPPTDWYIAGCLEAEIRVMLRRVHSESIQSLYFGTFVLVDNTCGSWDRLLILYIYIYREPLQWIQFKLICVISLLGCDNKKCIINMLPMRSESYHF